MTLDDLVKKENFRILVVDGSKPVHKKLRKLLTKKGYSTSKIKLRPEKGVGIANLMHEISAGDYELVFFNHTQISDPGYRELYALVGAMSVQTENKPDVGMFSVKGDVELEKVYKQIKLSHARRFYVKSCSNLNLVKEVLKLDLERVISAKIDFFQQALFEGPRTLNGDMTIIRGNGDINLDAIEMQLIEIYEMVRKRYNHEQNKALKQLNQGFKGTYLILFEKDIETGIKDFHDPEKIRQRIKEKVSEKELKEFKLEDHMVNGEGMGKLMFASIGPPIYNHALFIIEQKEKEYLCYDVIMPEGSANIGGLNIPYMDFMTKGAYEIEEDKIPGLLEAAKKDKYLSVLIVKNKEPNDISEEQKLSLAQQAYMKVKMSFTEKMNGG